MTTKTKATDRLTAIKEQRQGLHEQIQGLNTRRAMLAARLSELEAESAAHQEAIDRARAEFGEALASGDAEAIDRTRKAATSAAQKGGGDAARQAEVDATRQAIAALDAQGKPLADAVLALTDQEKELAALWVDEQAACLVERQQQLARLYGELLADAQGLNRLTVQLGRQAVYATGPNNSPTLALDGICQQGRLVVDLAELREAAHKRLLDALRADGFKVV